MKKYLFALAGILFFCAVTNCNAGEAANASIMAREIKFVSNLSGNERMLEMQKYVCGLPDPRLTALLDEIGAERFLADVQENRNRKKNRNPLVAQSHLPGKMGPTSPHTRQQQLNTALHTPERKMRLCRDIANYLLNTTH